MTPEQAAVIAAARELVRQNPYNLFTMGERAGDDLVTAVDALEAAEASGEMTLTYGQVVSEDLLWSEAKGKWFEVLEVATTGGQTQFRLKGVAAKFTKPATDEVRVQRSETGKAVDMFNTVIWSGVKS